MRKARAIEPFYSFRDPVSIVGTDPFTHVQPGNEASLGRRIWRLCKRLMANALNLDGGGDSGCEKIVSELKKRRWDFGVFEER